MGPHLQAVFGIVALLAIAWLLSERRRAVSWRQVALGLALTIAVALVMLKVPQISWFIMPLNRVVDAVAAATRAGTTLVFGYLGGGPLPFDPKFPGSEFILGLQALPIVLVISALTTLLFYWNVLPLVVRFFSWALQRTMGVGGAVGLSTAANIFVGMIEAPLFIRPYMERLTRSELFVVMTGGMAGIAGTVMVLYATILAPRIPGAFGHILIASVLGAPAAILISRIMVPETTRDAGTAAEGAPLEKIASSSMDAIVKGTVSGVGLLINIIAMLIVLVALVHLANGLLDLLPDIGGRPITLERTLGLVMAPVCWLMGVPWADAPVAGALMGEKTVLNEFVAYLHLAALPPDTLDPHSRVVMLYAMCGFANLGSLGILIGGLTAMVPERGAEIVRLGPKSLVSGTLTTCLLGAIVGAIV